VSGQHGTIKGGGYSSVKGGVIVATRSPKGEVPVRNGFHSKWSSPDVRGTEAVYGGTDAIDTVELGLGSPLFTFSEVVGNNREAGAVIVLIDRSGSMDDHAGLVDGKWMSKGDVATLAAGTIHKAVVDGNGQCIVMLFGNNLVHEVNGSPSIIVDENASEAAGGGTSFDFIPKVWAAHPKHRIVVLTDGESDPPTVSNRRDIDRTSVLVIGNPAPGVIANMRRWAKTVRRVDPTRIDEAIQSVIPVLNG